MKLFSPQSPLISFLARVGDMMFVNVAFLLACLPVFTFGAARTALYDCAAKWAAKEDAGVMTFFRSFRANFRSGLLPGLLVFVLTVLVCADFLYSFSAYGALHLRIITVIVMAVFFPYCEQIFLFLSRFSCKFGNLLRNTLIMCLSTPLRSILIALMMQLPVLVFLCAPELFLRLTMLWLLGYFSVAAFLAAGMMKKTHEAVIDVHNDEAEDDAPKIDES